MKTLMITACAVAGLAGHAFAQEAAMATCAEYAAMDNAGKMAMVAELQSIASETDGQEVTNADIENTLAANCGEDGAALLVDMIKKE